MNNNKFDVAKAALRDFRGAYSDLLLSAQRLEHALESISMEALEVGPQNEEVRVIVRAVAIDFELPMSSILSPLRTVAVSEARHMAMLISREKTGLCFQDLGIEFRRHHSAVMYGVKAAHNLIDTNPAFRARFERLSHELRSAA